MAAASLAAHTVLLVTVGMLEEHPQEQDGWRSVSFEILEPTLGPPDPLPPEPLPTPEPSQPETTPEPSRSPTDVQPAARRAVSGQRREIEPDTPAAGSTGLAGGLNATQQGSQIASNLGAEITSDTAAASLVEVEPETPSPENSAQQAETPPGPRVFEDDFGSFTFGPSRRAPSPQETAGHVGHLDHLDGDRPGGDPHASNEALAGRISSDLARATRVRHLSRRPDPVLRPTGDGGYTWQNEAITARISPNGEVEFGNNDIGGLRPAVGVVGIATNVDITGPLMRAQGQNPYRHEEQWFMNRTEEVRAQLRAEWSRRVMGEAIRELPARLARIWRRAGTASRRRQRLFETWAECDEGPDGNDARRIILRFIRERLPRGSAGAYTDTDLSALNRGRRGLQFRPYRAAPSASGSTPESPDED